MDSSKSCPPGTKGLLSGGSLFSTVPGLCGPIKTMPRGFSHSPTLRRTLLGSALSSSPHFRTWRRGAGGRGGGAAVLRPPPFAPRGGLSGGSGAASRSPSARRRCRGRGADCGWGRRAGRWLTCSRWVQQRSLELGSPARTVLAGGSRLCPVSVLGSVRPFPHPPRPRFRPLPLLRLARSGAGSGASDPLPPAHP